MGTIAASALVARCESELFDDTNVYWPEPELLRFLSDGQRQIVLLVPEAYPTNTVVQLRAGSRQSIPDNAYTFLTALANVTSALQADGTPAEPIVRGRAVRRVERTVMDHNHPQWHNAKPNVVAEHYVFDPDDRQHFYVYPPQPADAPGPPVVVNAGRMEIVYADVPAEIAAAADTISLNDNYATILFYYMMHRAHSKDMPEAMPQKAASFYRMFMEGLGLRVEQPGRLHPAQTEERRDN